MGASARREDEHAALRREEAPPAPALADGAPQALVGALQRAAGNRAVAGLLGRTSSTGPTLARVWLPWVPPVRLDPFLLLTFGLSEHSAPEEITLPSELEAGMKTAWDKSLPGTESLEHGGILVMKPGGGYEWKEGKPGTSGAFTPNYGDVKTGESLAVVGHTHPYSAKEGGHTNVSFSGGDLASFATDPDPVQVVRSGTGMFVAARTQEFNALLSGLTAAEKRKLSDEIEAYYDGALKSAKGKLPERSDEAAQATCLKYHLVYYRGTAAGKLKQPEAMVTARKLIKFVKEEVTPLLESVTK